jgi:hypothetical protein
MKLSYPNVFNNVVILFFDNMALPRSPGVYPKKGNNMANPGQHSWPLEI